LYSWSAGDELNDSLQGCRLKWAVATHRAVKLRYKRVKYLWSTRTGQQMKMGGGESPGFGSSRHRIAKKI